MLAQDLPEAFGKLRSMLSTPDVWAASLAALLRQAQAAHPSRFTQEWLPHLERQALPSLIVETFNQLDELDPWAPQSLPITLRLHREPFNHALARALAQHPALARVRALCLSSSVEPGALATLFESAHLQSLEVLALENSAALSLHDAQALAQDERLARLRTLALLSYTTDAAPTLELLATPHLTSLRHALPLIYTQEPRAATALIERLDALNQRHPLSHVSLAIASEHEIAALKRTSLPQTLRSLMLMVMRQASMSQLITQLTSPSWARLESLGLPFGALDAAQLEALSSAPWLPNLRALDLSRVNLNHDGALSLLAAPRMQALTHLNLNDTQLTLAALHASAQNPSLARLSSLDLGRFNQRTEGPALSKQALAPLLEPTFRLRTLRISNAWLAPEALQQLLIAPAYQHLEQLDLSYTWSDGDALIARLHEPSFLPKLTRLAIRGATISPHTLTTLAQSPRVTSLRALDLRGCSSLTNASVEALRAQAPHLEIIPIMGGAPNMFDFSKQLPHISPALDGLAP